MAIPLLYHVLANVRREPGVELTKQVGGARKRTSVAGFSAFINKANLEDSFRRLFSFLFFLNRSISAICFVLMLGRFVIGKREFRMDKKKILKDNNKGSKYNLEILHRIKICACHDVTVLVNDRPRV